MNSQCYISDESDVLNNPVHEESTNIQQQLKQFIENSDYAGVRKLLRRNQQQLNTLNTRDLNDDFPLDDHKFVKRNGKLTFITTTTSSPKERKHNNNYGSVNEFKQYAELMIKQHEYERKYEEMRNLINLHNDVINVIVNYLMQQDSRFGILIESTIQTSREPIITNHQSPITNNY